MSNPLVFVAGMDRALTIAVLVTGSALVVTLPWVRTPRVAFPVLFFLAWLLLSRAWSIQPEFTAAAWAQTAGTAAVAFVTYANASARILAFGFAGGGVAVSALSVYAFHEMLPGGSYLTQFGPELAGVGTNPNILSYTLALSLCGVFAAVPHKRWSRLVWLGAIGIIVYGLIVAESATGDLTAVVLAVVAVMLGSYRHVTRTYFRTMTRRVVAAISVVLAMAVAALVVARALGEDLLTFSDRTPLWSAAIAVAHERPLQGFGYGAVWQHPWKPPLLNIVIGDIWDRSGTALSHGHNSAIDLVIEVGVVGVVLMALVMITAGARCIGLLRVAGPGPGNPDDQGMARFIALCLIALVLFGITEPMSTIPLGWWTLVLLTEPATGRLPQSRLREGRRPGNWGGRADGSDSTARGDMGETLATP